MWNEGRRRIGEKGDILSLIKIEGEGKEGGKYYLQRIRGKGYVGMGIRGKGYPVYTPYRGDGGRRDRKMFFPYKRGGVKKRSGERGKNKEGR